MMTKKGLPELCREAIAQGCVLLQNDADTLPFTKADCVSLFGRCQIDFYKSGTGSGGSVHVPYAHNLVAGFTTLFNEGWKCPSLNERVSAIYRAWVSTHPFDNGSGEWASEPWFQEDMPITRSLLQSACDRDEKALYVIGRTAGEDKDNKAEPGSFYLTETERKNITVLCSYFERVTILLNVPGLIDLSWIGDECFKGHITAVLFCWHGGMEGGLGVADVLCGKKSPSGKLSDTIAWTLSDYPCLASKDTFGGDGDVHYKEDIFVGYRYFSTFAPEKMQFPFGFGLSYTTFSIEPEDLRYDGKAFTACVRVTNTGKATGRETVQIYAACPDGALKKSRRVLACYKKTGELKPEESERLTLSFPQAVIASYDESGATGFASSYVLEKGSYRFYAGSDLVHCAPLAFTGTADGDFLMPQTICIEKLESCCTSDAATLRERIESRSPAEIAFTGDRSIRFPEVAAALRSAGSAGTASPAADSAVAAGTASACPSTAAEDLLDRFVAQLTDNELFTLVRGEGMMSRKVTPGIAAAFGGLSKSLHDTYLIPAAGCADGPSGIRLDTGGEASLIPIGTLLACTWNDELVESLYALLGQEMAQKQIDLLLGPGCNIHRSPLNGRNFEYYSEDPLLSGKMAAAAVRGIEKGGALATIKHFACNNQEASRRFMNAVVSERALREIYLKPFEIAVKEGGARAVMTSYNGINGHWCSSNYDLIASLLRREWHYTGLVMTDWWAAMNDCVSGGKAQAKNLSELIRSENDLYMVVMNDTADKGGLGDNLATALESGSLSRASLQRSAKDVLRFIALTPAAKAPLRALTELVTVPTVLSSPKPGEKAAEAGDSLSWTDGKSAFLHVRDEGAYNLIGIYIKEGDDLSQSASCVYLNGTLVGSFSSRSTGGRPLSAAVSQLSLKAGYYELTITHTKPGIRVQSLVLRADNKLPPDTEKVFA